MDVATIDLLTPKAQTVRIIIGRLLAQDPTGAAACELFDRHCASKAKSVSVVNSFALVAVVCSDIALFNHLAAATIRVPSPFLRSLCEAAVFRAPVTVKECRVAFPASADAQVVAEAAMRLAGIHGPLQQLPPQTADLLATLVTAPEAVAQIILGRLLMQESGTDTACALYTRYLTTSEMKITSSVLNTFLFVAIVCSNIALFNHVVALAVALPRHFTKHWRGLCEAAVLRRGCHCIVAFPACADAQVVAEAALRLQGTRGDLENVLDSSYLHFSAFVQLNNARLNAVLYEFTPAKNRMSFVLHYALRGGMIPGGIRWRPLFTPDAAADFLRCLESASFSMDLCGTFASVVTVAQLWERCGLPDLDRHVMASSAWVGLVNNRTREERDAPEAAATTLLRQHILYFRERTRHMYLMKPEVLEACIVVANRRGDRLLTLNTLGEEVCDGAFLVQYLAMEMVGECIPISPTAKTRLDCVFTSNEVTDLAFVTDLRRVASEESNEVQEILAPYLRFECSLRGTWIKACVRIGFEEAEAEAQAEPVGKCVRTA